MSGTRDHYAEAYIEDGVADYGWQCFTCGQERDGFETFSDAEEAAQRHTEFAGQIGWAAS